MAQDERTLMQLLDIDQKEWETILRESARAERLFVTEETLSSAIERIRQSADYAPMVQEIREEAERLLAEPIPILPWSKHRLFKDEGLRLPYEELYFARRRRLTALALMTLLDEERADYESGLLDTIWAICDEYSWCLPAHLPRSRHKKQQALLTTDDRWMRQHDGIWIDLFAAETAFTLAEISSLLADRLPDEVHERLKYEVYRRVLYPYMNMGPFGWEEARHNWSAVCAGSIAAAAIYLMEDDGELARVLDQAVRSLDCFLQGYAADGACMEGIYYWGYGFGFYVYAADLIKKRTGGAVDLFQPDKIREIAAFQVRCFLSGDKVANFADSGPTGSVHIGLSHYLSRLYPDLEVPETSLRAKFHEDHCGRWAPAVRNLIWYDPDIQGKPWEAASYWLEDAQWLISRHVRGEDVFAFAAKGGHNGEPHNHNDVGNFILHANGVSVLPDMGWGMYSAQYFGDDRYQFICTSSEGHSLPIIDGKLQEPGANRRAKVRQVDSSIERDVLELEIGAAYEVEGLESLVRRFEWSKQDEPVMTLLDTYTFSTTSSESAESGHWIVERFICSSRPDKIARNCYVIDRGRRSQLMIKFDCERMASEVQVLTIQDHHGQMVNYYALDFSFTVTGDSADVRFEFSFGN